MILSYQTIKQLCYEKGLVSPWEERTIFQGMSYGLGSASYDFRIAQNLYLEPNIMTLCSTIEQVNIPDWIAARVCDKSSWARRGVVVQNTHFDPGFRGYPTIELTNHTKYPIHIEKGAPICQFVFHRLDFSTTKPYSGKYQGQLAAPTEAKLE